MRARIIPLFIVLWISALPCAEAATARTRLVVAIAVDQMRSDYLTRFEHLFLPPTQKGGAPGGFRYLMDKGAYFPYAQTGHTPNVTAVGHAAMLTGALPHLHGIVGNYWIDRDTNKDLYCVEDPKEKIVGKPGDETKAGKSPRQLLVTTVGDELKNAMGGKPLVATVAIKDRAAIIMGGHRADLAIWYGEKIKYYDRGANPAQWATSTYYVPEGKMLPAWLVKWNAYDYLSNQVPKMWTKLLPEKAYELSSETPPESVGSGRGLGPSFPHAIANAGAFTTSPWGSAYTLDTAIEVVKGMKLGSHDVPDMLGVSLSSFDALGHSFGPMSAEMQDATVRLDRSLAEFFGQLAHLVPGGLANVVFVLTADHGVQVNPAIAEKLRLPGGIYDGDTLAVTINAALKEKFGFDSEEKPVLKIEDQQVFFDHALIKKRKKDEGEVTRVAAAALREQNFIAFAFSKQELLSGAGAATKIAHKLAASVHSTRSGDVLFVPRPGYLQLEEHSTKGTGHEIALVHDASVPLIFAGAPFKAGRYADEASLIDLAPTLSAALGIIAPSGSEGKVLAHALRATP
jgi:hypothetical protein